tara:strand:- start:442 stop:600 length:159 start_codon:yes stop_codon:yes gene_type:complete
MKIGDLVDDGLDNIGIIVDYGWYPLHRIRAYLVHFPDTTQNGWYSDADLEAV